MVSTRRRKFEDAAKEDDGDVSTNGTAVIERSVKKEKKSEKEKKKKDGVSLLRRVLSKLKYLVLFIIVPPFINYASLQKEMAELKPEGELYDIGWGQKLFMMCQGEGVPTVILDAPTGMSSDVWSQVWPHVAKHTKVCVYDRAGLGFSDRPSFNESQGNSTNTGQVFTVERMVADLHRLITSSSQQPRPLILVGAELGATIAHFYTQMFDSDVSGMILINPLTESLFKQDNGLWIRHWFRQLVPTYQALQLGAALGFTRLALLFGVLKHPLVGVDDIDQVVQYRQKHLLCHPKHLSSVVDEHYFINDTFSQIRTAKLIKRLPSSIDVSVMTGNYYDEQMPSTLNKAWAKAEQQLISRDLPTAQHLVVNGADRHMIYKQPRDVVEVILKMVRHHKHQQKNTKSK